MRRLLLLALPLALGCGTTGLARPVGAGNTRVTASLGGPLVVFGGAPVPIPVTTLGVAHGVSDAVDVHGEVQPTAAAFGVAGLGLGAAWHPLPQRGLLTFGLDAYAFGNGRDAVVLADPWLASRGRVTPWLSVAGGLHFATRVATSSAYARGLAALAPVVFAQAAFHIGRLTLEVEPRWYALGQCADCLAPDYVSPGKGALGLALGVAFDRREVTR